MNCAHFLGVRQISRYYRVISTFPYFFRSIRFEYDEKTNVEGASGYRYKLGKNFVSNSSEVPENSCYNPSPSPDMVRFVPLQGGRSIMSPQKSDSKND